MPRHRLIADLRKTEVEVRIDGRLAGRATFAKPGLQTVAWTLAAAPAGEVNVEFHVAGLSPPGRPAPAGHRHHGLRVSLA